MRYEEPRPTNGHNHPSWELFGILSEIRHDIGGLKVGQELTREQMTDGFERVHERIDVVHERMDTHLVTPKPVRRGWTEYSGLSIRETAYLAIVVGMAVTGTLNSDMLVALLSK